MTLTTADQSGEPTTSGPPRSYVDGPFAPVAEERTAFDLPVTGTLPAELTGRYVRNGPNPIEPDPATQHWFTGAGMVHGVRLDEGRAHWYRNRYVRTANVTEALGEPAIPAARQAEGVSGSVNTNVVALGGRTLALVEAGSSPVELSYELDSMASVDFDGTLPGAFSAHPHRDPRTGRWHAVTYYWPEEAVRHVVVGPDGRVERNVAIDVGERLMVHDTAITASSVLLFDFPVTFDLEAAMSGIAGVLPYYWNESRPARVGVLALDGSADDVRWCSVPTGFVFHAFNAFDRDDGRIELDVVRWPRVFDLDRLGPGEGSSRVERWTLDPASGTSSTAVVDDTSVEFPRIDERRTGAHHRFGYAAGMPVPGAAHAPLHRFDFDRQVAESYDFGPTSAAQEFVFVPRESGTAEDEGWLLGLVTDRASATTDLAVLAADDLAGGPVARVHLPARVPDGFHGNWLADAAG